jgi:cytochrome P450
MPEATLSPADFSHNQIEYIPDPFSFYAAMRTKCPAYLSTKIFGGTWLFFSFRDCLALIKDERLSNARATVPLRFLPSAQQEQFSDMIDIYERWLAFHDSQRHNVNRRQANRSYMPFSDAALEPRIQSLVDKLLDQVNPDGFDLMSEFAFPLPAMVIADVLGVPVEAHADLTRWTDDIAHLFGSTQISFEHLVRTSASTAELAEFLASDECAALSRRRNGLLHRLRESEVRGHRFEERDAVAQAALLLFAGVASIRYLIGNSVYALDQRPPAERKLLLDLRTVTAAIEELLRFCTPVQFVGRVAAKNFDYRLADGSVAQLQAGQPVLLYVGSANRDPDQFERPDELWLTRPEPNRHLTFGAGRHLCFGDPLVRQTTRVALSSLYSRMPSLTLRPQELNWNNNLGFHGFTKLQVTAHGLDDSRAGTADA